MRKMFHSLAILAILAGVVSTGPSPAKAQDAPLVTQLTENVYSVFSLFYNSLVVVGDDGVLITDPANGYRAGLLKAEISKITEKPVTRIALTHEHFDHTGGTEVFEGAQIIAQQNVGAVFGFDPLGLAPDQVDVMFSSEHGIDLGNTKVELKHLGAGDGVATTVVYLPAEEIVASADLYDDGQLTLGAFLDDKNMLSIHSILTQVAKWTLKHAVNAHSPGTDPAVLRANADYYNDLYDAVYPKIEQTMKTDPSAVWDLPVSLSKSVKLPRYESWKNYDQLPHHVRRMVLAIIHGG
ncbi:MAG: MBL fold metallo-hydrolase [Aestuariivirgaceae bacterium]